MGKPIRRRVGQCRACGKGNLELVSNTDISEDEKIFNKTLGEEESNYHLMPHNKIDGNEEKPCEGANECPTAIVWTFVPLSKP